MTSNEWRPVIDRNGAEMLPPFMNRWHGANIVLCHTIIDDIWP